MRGRATVAAGVAVLVAGTGCGLFSDEPYLIEELTVVAIVAEPPEVHPGEVALLTAYVADPRRPHATPRVTWSYCTRRGTSESVRACSDDAVSIQAAAPQLLMPALSISKAAHFVSAEAVAHVPRAILEVGFWEHVRAYAQGGDDELEAFKRLVIVADSVVPNSNPRLWDVRLRAGSEVLDAPYRLRPGAEVQLEPQFDAAGFEEYRVLAADGSWQLRQEAPVFTWHVTGGKLDPWVTDGTDTPRWELPDDEEDSPLLLFCVLRDGRGGVAVWVAEVAVGS